LIRTDLTSLRIFLAVYNLGNLTKAAEREHIAPSAVSKRIQDLELELGTPLFYRHARGVTATPAGEVLAGHTHRIFDEFNRMAADLSAYAEGIRGQVRIHAHTSAVVQYLPQEIAAFVRQYPTVRVTLREEGSPHVLEATLDGISDIGIIASNVAPAMGLEILPYRQDRLVALFPEDHPQAALDRIDFAQMRGTDYISLETGSSLQVLLAQAAESLGFLLNTRIEVTTFEAAIRMVEAGLGVAVVPDGVVQAFAGNLRVKGVPLSNDWALRNLVICVKDPHRLTAAAKLMLEHLRAGAADDYRKTIPPVPIRKLRSGRGSA
jgi:DNA-binding transcriptional LysR family regulator